MKIVESNYLVHNFTLFAYWSYLRSKFQNESSFVSNKRVWLTMMLISATFEVAVAALAAVVAVALTEVSVVVDSVIFSSRSLVLVAVTNNANADTKANEKQMVIGFVQDLKRS